MSRWEKSHTRNKLQSFCTFHQIFTVKTLKTPLNTHLKFFRISIFLRQDKLFFNTDIIIFPNTAIPIGEGLLLRLNDLEWTLNFFHSGTRVGWPHFYSQRILDGAQNMNVRSSIPNWNSNFLFVLRSWWDEFHIVLLFACSSRWKNVSFITEPWVTSKTRAYGNITLT